MNITDRIKELHSEAAKIHQEGVKGYSRIKTARLLGLSQLIQFDKQKTLRLDVGCWMLGQLNEKQIKKQDEFVNTYVLPVPLPGEVKDKGLLEEVLSESRITDAFKPVIIEILYEGKGVNEVGLSGVKKQNLMKILETTKAALLQKMGKNYPASAFIQPLEGKLKCMSPWFFIQFITQSSGDKINRIAKTELFLDANEIATVHLATIMPREKLAIYESAVCEMLSHIERFRHEYDVLIKKMAPLLIESSTPMKPPLWISFFDHDSRARTPGLVDLTTVYNKARILSDLSADQIREKLKEVYGENSRVRINQFGETKRVMDKTGLSLSEIHKKLGFKSDVALFYRSFKKWEKDSSYTEYWRQM
ncbi:hypothetical protein JCM30760_26620 [Thiomicrorhabdus hydrogeniphila]